MAYIKRYYKQDLGDSRHSFLVTDEENIIVVDTGTNRNSFSLLKEVIEELGHKVSMSVLITHSHIDHTGGLKNLIKMTEDNPEKMEINTVYMDASILKTSQIVEAQDKISIKDLEISDREEALNILAYSRIFFGSKSEEYKNTKKMFEKDGYVFDEKQDVTIRINTIYNEMASNVKNELEKSETINNNKQKLDIKTKDYRKRIVSLIETVRVLKDKNIEVKGVDSETLKRVDNFRTQNVEIQALKVSRSKCLDFYKKLSDEELLNRLCLKDYEKEYDGYRKDINKLQQKQMLMYLNLNEEDIKKISKGEIKEKVFADKVRNQIASKLSNANANHDNIPYIIKGDDEVSVISLGDMELLQEEIFIEAVKSGELKLGKILIIEIPHHTHKTSFGVKLIEFLKEESYKQYSQPIFVEQRGSDINKEDLELFREKCDFTGIPYETPIGDNFHLKREDTEIKIYSKLFSNVAQKLKTPEEQLKFLNGENLRLFLEGMEIYRNYKLDEEICQ